MEQSKIVELEENTSKEVANAIQKDTEEAIENLKTDVNEAPNVLNTTPEVNEEECVEKDMNIIVDPDTGEHKILGEVKEEQKNDKSFDDLVKKINESKGTSDELFGERPISESDVMDFLSNTDDSEALSQLSPESGLSNEAVQGLLKIINRRMNGEKFNIYKELPEEVKTMVDLYADIDRLSASIGGATTANINQMKNIIATSLIDEFISDVNIKRAKSDFAMELEQIYRSSVKDIEDANLEYIEDRNKTYREAADKIEDESKREKLKAILDRIDDARDLTELKEFASKCKIKKIELEKPATRVFNSFLGKYKDSTNNIYDINIARKVLSRHMELEYDCSEGDVIAFLICFCKYVYNFSVNEATDHAFMYYVMYYCAMLDSDKSDKFKNNVYDVIVALRKRNGIGGF